MPWSAISRRTLLEGLAGVSVGRAPDYPWRIGVDAPQLHEAAPAADPVSGPLFAAALSPELGQTDDLYGRLIGSWDVDVIDYASDGAKRTASGEWHFARALEGRAVQDVYIVPKRSERGDGLSRQGNRYGTTVRYYDPVRKIWRIVWVNPVNGALNVLDARKEGDRIVQEGADGDVRHRWSFVSITEDRFHWLGEFSTDEGKTWRTSAEFFARRSASR